MHGGVRPYILFLVMATIQRDPTTYSQVED